MSKKRKLNLVLEGLKAGLEGGAAVAGLGLGEARRGRRGKGPPGAGEGEGGYDDAEEDFTDMEGKPANPLPNPPDNWGMKERDLHEGFMREALAMVCLLPESVHMELWLPATTMKRSKMIQLTRTQAELALMTDETPVGCVFVHDGKIIARGMNATNRTLNGTRHAELMAISSMMSPVGFPTVKEPNVIPTDGAAAPIVPVPLADSGVIIPRKEQTPATEEVLASLPPKILFMDPDAPDLKVQQAARPPPRYPASILKECTLYVTVEPCVMCASLLRQFQVKEVFFGAANDRFGGTGGVFNIHSCKSMDQPYPVSGGWLRKEAILLLRRFYVQENGRAPVPRGKKGRVLKVEVEEVGSMMVRSQSKERTPVEDEKIDTENDKIVVKLPGSAVSSPVEGHFTLVDKVHTETVEEAGVTIQRLAVEDSIKITTKPGSVEVEVQHDERPVAEEQSAPQQPM
jgi:tRNA(Arg) A34 adenosine deaminase TadA